MPTHRITHIRIANPTSTNEHITHVRVSGLGKACTETIDTVVTSIKQGQHYYILLNDEKVSVTCDRDFRGKEHIRTRAEETKIDGLLCLPKF